MSEDELQIGITEAATLTGWRWYHVRQSNGVSMGHMGFPDLVLAKRGRVLFLELKSETGAPSSEQSEWLLAIDPMQPSSIADLEQLPRMGAFLVRPADYDRLLELLQSDPWAELELGETEH